MKCRILEKSERVIGEFRRTRYWIALRLQENR